ncbi:replication initiation protein [Klebsiella pneumoniae]|uniref:Replication initiation protein n=5 Tax=Enterobacteriaceae TaxID=543 RepID=A0ABZ2DW50_RAOOR|nr:MULTISPECIES: replication initiation protein [Enterobacteriaceae]ELO7118828.1 replication initiation protein [Escherichia coli]HAT2206891.1 replication protein [Kluyvera intermedia]HAT2278802.1 replication protein [Raoultella ornithinolytica]AKL15182.1 replication protein [Phytobacter ursingii]MBG1741946.1 replication initiation protein [Klebsiella pneumoniae]
MPLKQDIYNIEQFKNKIQKYALCCDDFYDGVYRTPKDKALLKKYIAFNNKSFINGLVFDVDHQNGAIAWDLADLPKPNIIIQNTRNGHAHLLYALKTPVLKTDAARMKPLRLASIVQRGFTERLDADRAYADILMKNPININEWRTTWTNIPEYDLYYLADFVPDIITTPKTKPSPVYGLGRNVNLFEDLRILSYKDVLKYKANNTYYDFYEHMLSRAIMLNNHCNVNDLLSHNEVNQICKSICKWTWRNFSQSRFSEIQSARARKNTAPRKTKELIKFLEEL